MHDVFIFWTPSPFLCIYESPLYKYNCLKLDFVANLNIIYRFRDIKRQMRRSRYGNVGMGSSLPNDDEGGTMADVPHWEVFLKIGLYHMHKKGYEKALANFSQAQGLERTGNEPRCVTDAVSAKRRRKRQT